MVIKRLLKNRTQFIFGKMSKFINRFGFKNLFILLYLTILFLGIILTFIYAFIPSFVTCSSLFGTNFCTPTGIFILLFFSLPGYLLAGNLLSSIKEIPWVLSFVIVMITSLAFYYFLGMLIDKARFKKFKSENLSIFLVVSIFIILLFLVISLL